VIRCDLLERTVTTDLFEKGEQVRREVLGEAYVTASTASSTPLTEPLREFAIKNLWGDIWSRPELDRRSRSIVVLSILAATNRPEELKIHIRGALNNGLKRDEIREIFLQSALYCGIPTGGDCTRIAKQVFADIDSAQAK
jgi:4-carboxymuconolactone decarboxylase